MAEDTPVKEPDAVDWEKRYKDEQKKISELAEEKKALSEELSKQKQTLEAVQPYINWDAATGTPQDTEADPVDTKMKKLEQDMADKIAWGMFKAQNPDLVPHEALVLSFVQKSTGTREERLEKAKKLTQDYINSLREEGKKAAIEQKEETVKAEAEAGGLAPTATPPTDGKPPTMSEVNINYLESRKAASAKARGYS